MTEIGCHGVRHIVAKHRAFNLELAQREAVESVNGKLVERFIECGDICAYRSFDRFSTA